MNTNLRFIILLVATALLSSTAFFFFPEIDQAGVAYIVAIAFAASITQLLAVWYFLSSLKTFKRGLKTAYYWVALGIFLFSLVLLVPSISVFWPPIIGSVVVNNIVVLTPYSLGALCMYIGMRQFAKLLGSHHRFSSFWMVAAAAAVMVGVVVALPHPGHDSIRTFAYSFGPVVWSAVFGIAAMVMALHIRQIIGSVYKKAMVWMAVALALLVAASLQELVAKIYFLTSHYVVAQFNLAWYALVGILFLRAGLAFKETGRGSLRLPENASHVDIVARVAQLVSKPAEVDKELDKLRAITAEQGQATQALSPADKATLTNLYLYIENYLLTKEPLHAFTKEGLRNGLPDGFVQELAHTSLYSSNNK